MPAQTAIFTEDAPYHHYLEFTVTKDTDAVSKALSVLWQSDLDKDNVVIGFGPTLWRAISPEENYPEDLIDFTELTAPNGKKALATQRDIWVWTSADSASNALTTALTVHNVLSEVATLDLDCPAFVHRDKRDLTGFIDGVGNPEPENQPEAALIPEGKNGAGGSIVMTQKWAHNLNAFNEQPVKTQEGIIGRTKEDAVELSRDVMPMDAHVRRTDLKVNGEALKIVRRSKPFGTVTEHGLYFVAFSQSTHRISLQLDSMYGLTEDKITDKIIDFSDAVTGSYWYAPTTEVLDTVFS